MCVSDKTCGNEHLESCQSLYRRCQLEQVNLSVVATQTVHGLFRMVYQAIVNTFCKASSAVTTIRLMPGMVPGLSEFNTMV